MIHVYEYDQGSMVGCANGYYEIYQGEYGEGDLCYTADNDTVFEKAKTLADNLQLDIVLHTAAHWEWKEEMGLL